MTTTALTDEDRALILEALAIAAHRFDEYAKENHTLPHPTSEWNDKVRDAFDLAARIRRSVSLSINQ